MDKQKAYQKLIMDTNKYKQIVRTVKGFESQIEAIRQYMFAQYLSQYSRDSARVLDFLVGNGGNCEAQTKLVVDALLQSGIQIPSHYILGVQQFKDHVQPVLYNVKTEEVWEFVSGKRSREIKAPIYRPPILLHAFLMGQNVVPIVNTNSLLIVAANNIMKSGTKNGRTNTSLKFSGGEGYYNDGEVPEYAKMSAGEGSDIGEFSRTVSSSVVVRFIDYVKAFFS